MLGNVLDRFVVPENERALSKDIFDRRYEETLKSVPSEHIILALEACQKAGEWREGLILFRGAVKSGHTRTARMYAAVASAMSASDKPARALKLLNEAGHAGVKKSLAIYHAALHACARHGWWEKANGLIGNAMKSNLNPDAITFTILISSFIKHGKWAHALRTLKRLENRGLCKDSKAVAAANQAMFVCIKGKAWMRALHIFEQWMPRTGIVPDIQSVNVALRAHGRGGSWQSALALFRRLPGFSLDPNVHTIISLATALHLAGKWKEAFLRLQNLGDIGGGLEHNSVNSNK